MAKKNYLASQKFARVHPNALRDLKGLEFRVYCALALHADAEGRCYPSQERLTQVLGMRPSSVRSVRKALQGLQDKHWIVKTRQGSKKDARANDYQLKYTGSVTTQIEGELLPSTGSVTTQIEGHIDPPNISITNHKQTINSENTKTSINDCLDDDFLTADCKPKAYCADCGAPERYAHHPACRTLAG